VLLGAGLVLLLLVLHGLLLLHELLLLHGLLPLHGLLLLLLLLGMGVGAVVCWGLGIVLLLVVVLVLVVLVLLVAGLGRGLPRLRPGQVGRHSRRCSGAAACTARPQHLRTGTPWDLAGGTRHLHRFEKTSSRRSSRRSRSSTQQPLVHRQAPTPSQAGTARAQRPHLLVGMRDELQPAGGAQPSKGGQPAARRVRLPLLLSQESQQAPGQAAAPVAGQRGEAALGLQQLVRHHHALQHALLCSLRRQALRVPSVSGIKGVPAP
jgi:hypothetical protein